MTGASGFIGQKLLDTLGTTHDITVLGRSAGATTAPHQLQKCDLNDPAAVTTSLKNLESQAPFDAIIHLAVSRLHRDFPTSALDLFHINAVATAYLMDFAYRTQVGHVLLGSTGSVYNVPDGVHPNEAHYTEPKSYFAASKLAADCLAEQYRSVFPVSILRFFVPYGPGLEGRMLSSLATNLRAGRPVLVPETGPALTFAPIYIDDVLAVVNSCLREVWNDTVNVASDEAFSLDAAAHIIGTHLGVDVTVKTDASASPYYLVPDISRLKARTDISTFTSFSDGMLSLLRAGNYGMPK